MKGRGVPSGYVEGLNDARTLLADFFSILLENPRQLRLNTQLPPSGGASIPSLEGWSKFLIAVFSHCRGGRRNLGGTTEEAPMKLGNPVLKGNNQNRDGGI